MRTLRELPATWASIYDARVWLAAQLLHWAWTVSNTSGASVGTWDQLSRYVGHSWGTICLLVGLLLPYVIFQLCVSNKDVDTRELQPIGNRSKDVLIDGLVQPVLVLDSNIWMHPDLDRFFSTLGHRLKSEHRNLLLFGPQFDELCNIKDRVPYGSRQGRLARLALSRIERLQVMNCLIVDPLLLQAVPKTFADPLILELLRELTSTGLSVKFVTDDRELRIRARQIVKDAPGKLTVRSSADLTSNQKSNGLTF